MTGRRSLNSQLKLIYHEDVLAFLSLVYITDNGQSQLDV